MKRATQHGADGKRVQTLPSGDMPGALRAALASSTDSRTVAGELGRTPPATLSPLSQRSANMDNLYTYHRQCPCPDCGLEREIDVAVDQARPIDLTDEERGLLADILAVDE